MDICCLPTASLYVLALNTTTSMPQMREFYLAVTSNEGNKLKKKLGQNREKTHERISLRAFPKFVSNPILIIIFLYMCGMW